ncbi:MAG: DUF5329 family protein [Planctomycetaceae bacterium]
MSSPYRFVLTRAVLFVLIPASVTLSDDAPAKSLTETEKITALIDHVENLEKTKFIRNGSAYDAKTAADFLRRKWKSRKSKIKTANDFIEQVATKSSISGKPYLIRFDDGNETKSGEYLREQLKTLEDSP